jgi:general stress protein 26
MCNGSGYNYAYNMFTAVYSVMEDVKIHICVTINKDGAIHDKYHMLQSTLPFQFGD